MDQTFYELLGLFGSAFLSATILPGTSEAVMIGILALGKANVYEVLLVATIGNMLGSLVNWGIGYFFASYRDHPKFPLTREKFDRYSVWFNKYGVWALLLSWIPLIGDALTIIAGMMRTNLILVAAIVFVAKGLRYVVVASATVALL